MAHKPKKSLGQNFLKSNVALSQIISAGEVTDKDTILEIGPGKGALTEKLLEKAKKVIAIEKDNDLFLFLKEKFNTEIKDNKLELINEDILNYDIKLKNYKLIANIPYNITGAIFKKFLSNQKPPAIMVFLVQKEVAERIVAKDKKESILSISVKIYGVPKYIAKVSKKYFSPSPKVDSAIIKVANISKNNFKNEKEENFFFEILKMGFLHKRKFLIKNLEKVSNKEILKEIFDNLKIKQTERAENIHTEQWIKLSHNLFLAKNK